MTKCDAKKAGLCDANDKHLWLRDNVFYYFAELPRVNGKRRYLRQSLKTSNYYEALERIKGLNNPAANDFVKSHTAPVQLRIAPVKHKISEIIESMLLKADMRKRMFTTAANVRNSVIASKIQKTA